MTQNWCQQQQKHLCAVHFLLNKEKLSHSELLVLHMDPDREGVCVARSTQVLLVLILRFWAQSIMQVLPDILNMIGGLTVVSAAWSKERPTGWLDKEVSEITCKDELSKMNIKMLYILLWNPVKQSVCVWSLTVNGYYTVSSMVNYNILLVMAGVLCISPCTGHFWLSSYSELSRWFHLLSYI